MRAIAAAVLAVGGLGLAARADDKPLDRAEVDRRAEKVAHDTIAYGTRLWEAKNYDGTAKLYEGGLYALLTFVDHRPKLVELITDRMNRASQLPPEKGAFLLREALDAVRAETAGLDPRTAPAPKEKAEPKPADKKVADVKSFRDRLGGDDRVKALARDTAAAVVGDPKVDHLKEVKPADRAAVEQTARDFLAAQLATILRANDVAQVPAGALRGWERWSDEEFRAVVGQVKGVLERAGVAAADVAEAVSRVEQARKAAGKK